MLLKLIWLFTLCAKILVRTVSSDGSSHDTPYRGLSAQSLRPADKG